MKAYADLADLPEDERITRMAWIARDNPGRVLACVTDAEPKEKAERYARKLKNAAALIEIIDTVDGPLPGMVTIRFHVPLRPKP